MDLNAYLLDDLVESTTPRGESAAKAQSRREAIAEMFKALDPRDGLQAMIACQCITLRFLLNAAMRDTGNVNQEPDAARSRTGVVAISKTLHQWVSKLEKIQQRNETRAAEQRKAAAAEVAAVPAKEPKQFAPASQSPTVPSNQSGSVAASGQQPAMPGSVVPDSGLPADVAVRSPGTRPPPPGDGPEVRAAA